MDSGSSNSGDALDCVDSASSPATDNIEKQTTELKHSKSIIEFFGSESYDEVDSTSEKGTIREETQKNPRFCYDMNHEKRGSFVIFNHEEFDIKDVSKRMGSHLDRDNLLDVAKEKLGFEVFTHDNYTHKEIVETIKEYAAEDHSNNDCFACAILSHGREGDMLYAKDEEYNLRELIEPIRDCETLKQKPKLFFIQTDRGKKLDPGTGYDGSYATVSCDRGKKLDPGTGYDGTYATVSCEETTVKGERIIPIEADIFIGYSTVEGYTSWRNIEKGSWFIQALVSCLEKYAEHMELMHIMTRVNNMVAYDYESNVRKEHNHLDKKKQMPKFTSSLTGEVYFCEKAKVELTTDTVKSLQSKDLINAELELISITKKELELKLQKEATKEKI